MFVATALDRKSWPVFKRSFVLAQKAAGIIPPYKQKSLIQTGLSHALRLQLPQPYLLHARSAERSRAGLAGWRVRHRRGDCTQRRHYWAIVGRGSVDPAEQHRRGRRFVNNLPTIKMDTKSGGNNPALQIPKPLQQSV